MADYEFSYTGPNMNAYFGTIKELQDNGYIFKGVATPTTNPGTTTEKCAYIASEAGTYTNFGNLAVTGLSVLTYNGTAWSVINFNLNVDNTPLDLSSFTRSAGCPHGWLYWIVQDNRTHIDIPVQAGQMYRICANSSFDAIFVLLKQTQTPTDHLPYDFATGEYHTRVIPAGSCGTVTIPSDCTLC